MCLGVPGKILTINDNAPPLSEGHVQFGGIRKTVNLSFVPDAQVGDYVIVHAGFAISRINEDEAQRVLQELAALGEMENAGDRQ